MNRHVPHQNSFKVAKKYDKWQTCVLWTSTALTVLSITLNNINQPLLFTFQRVSLINWVNSFASCFAVFYIVLDILINDKFYLSGVEKRLDLIDHAYDKNFSGDKSVGYFNAQGVPIGLYKLAVQSFENSLFTSTIAKKMAARKWWMAGFIFTVFLISACLGNKDLVNNILQIAATGVLIQQTIRLQQFANRMGNIHADFKMLFTIMKDEANKSKYDGEMIKNILDYECTHSWGSILLNDKIFNKQNTELSEKWEGMKKGYNIS